MKISKIFIFGALVAFLGCGGGTSGTASGDVIVRASLSNTTGASEPIELQSLSSSVTIPDGSSGEVHAPRLEGVIPIIITRHCNCPGGLFRQVFNLDGIDVNSVLVQLGIIINGAKDADVEIKEVK